EILTHQARAHIANAVAQTRIVSVARNPLDAGNLTGVCTENLIRIDCVTESPNVNGDDRALLPLPDPVRLAVQVEEPTWSRERGAPSSTDCAAAQGAGSGPAHKWGSLVLGPAVSMVSIGAQVHHYHPTGDPR